MLATRETLYLLHEDHQWRKSSPGHPDQSGGGGSGSVDVLETLPISCVSSVQLWPQDPRRMDVKLYDEVGGAKAHFFTFFTPPPFQSGKFFVVMVVSWMYCIQRGVKKKAEAFCGAVASHRKHFSERGGPQSGTVRQFRASV